MHKLSYDIHIHSCLSPCGDKDMTPANIARMASLQGIDVVALTDHNSCGNCEAFIHNCEKFGIIGIPGMEITTIEEVHALCLFDNLETALSFNNYVYERLIKIPNKEHIFGEQIICDKNDNKIKKEEYLLINAVDISFKNLYDTVNEFNGIMIPAHIDKTTNSLLSNLGIIGCENKFRLYEVGNIKNIGKLENDNPYLKNCKSINNSDAHSLSQLCKSKNIIYVENKTSKSVLNYFKNKF